MKRYAVSVEVFLKCLKEIRPQCLVRDTTENSAVRTDFGVPEPRTACSKASSQIQGLVIPPHSGTADFSQINCVNMKNFLVTGVQHRHNLKCQLRYFFFMCHQSALPSVSSQESIKIHAKKKKESHFWQGRALQHWKREILEELRQTHSWKLKKLHQPLAVPIPDYLFAELPKAGGGCRGKKGQGRGGKPSQKRLQAAATSQGDKTKHPLNTAASAGMRGGRRRCGAAEGDAGGKAPAAAATDIAPGPFPFRGVTQSPAAAGERGCSEQLRRLSRPLRAPGSLRGGRAGPCRGGRGGTAARGPPFI